MTTNQLAYQNLMEKIRNDQAIEAETNRHNKAVEDYNSGVLSDSVFRSQESARHNRVLEQLQDRANAIESQRVVLQARQNELNYQLGIIRATEEQRHNEITERVSALQESHNYLLGQYKAETERNSAQWRHEENVQQLTETHRHNILTEIEGGVNAGSSFLGNMFRGISLLAGTN